MVTVDKGDVLDKYDIDILKSDVIKNKSIEKNYYRIYSSKDPIDNLLDTDVDLKSIEPFEIDNAENKDKINKDESLESEQKDYTLEEIAVNWFEKNTNKEEK